MGPSKRFFVVLALVGAGAVACANGDASGNQAAEAMENADLNEDTARCVGNELEATLEQDELNNLAKASSLTDLAGVAVRGTEEDLAQVARGVLADCIGRYGTTGADTASDTTEADADDSDE